MHLTPRDPRRSARQDLRRDPVGDAHRGRRPGRVAAAAAVSVSALLVALVLPGAGPSAQATSAPMPAQTLHQPSAGPGSGVPLVVRHAKAATKTTAATNTTAAPKTKAAATKAAPKTTAAPRTVPSEPSVPTTTPPPPQCTPSATQTLRGVTQARSGYLPLLKPSQAWPIARGAGVRVALMDTGVNAAAGRAGGVLAGRLVDGGNFAPDTDKLSGLLDCNGQGTGDASLLAATDAGSGLPGLAPDATVVSVRVQYDADVAPKPAAVVRGIAAAMSKGAQVIVLASPSGPSAALAAVVRKAVRAGVLIVAAVGDPQTATTTSYPAMYPGVIGVAASGSSSATAATGSFVDLSAPGTGLAVLSILGRGYVNGQGTARAAALAAGTAALVRSAYPTLKLPAMTTRLEYSADHPAGTVPNTTAGWGVVNPYAALTLPADRTAAPTQAPASQLGAVVLPPPDNPHRRYVGAALAAVLLCTALAATAALAGVRRARRRRWRVARHH